MSNEIVAPTLSTFGWVTAVAEKIDFLLAHYVNSDGEQDSIHGSNVSNMQVIVQKYSDKPSEMASALRSSLQQYLTRYYPDGVVVDTRVTPAKDQPVVNENRVNIAFNIYFQIKDKEYSAPHQLTLIDSKFHTFARENNG